MPPVVLWAWERPEDLRFLDPRECGVAFLAETLILRADRVIVRPRMQPLALAADTRRIAVARIESEARERPILSDGQRARVVEAISGLASLQDVAAIQIDFDARASERDFYRAVLFDLRKRLPQSSRLSITALASWCLGDNWISDLPVDEAVPMLFRMGTDRENIAARMRNGGEFSALLARFSVGISTDEPPRTSLGVRFGVGFRGRRIYIFNPRPWSPESVRQITREVQQW